MGNTLSRRLLVVCTVLSILLSMLIALPATLAPARAANTPDPSSVTIAGSLQSELGCSGDWDPACAATHLGYDAGDDVWQGTWTVPAGSFEYKAALNDSWDENYGLHAAPSGANIPLNLGADTSVKFYYDHKSHWVTDNVSSVIATVPGSFQSALDCPGDWQPDCLRSWLQDIDGDGIYSFETTALLAGSYEAKAAINESWTENYGQGGVPGGANIPFTVPADHAKVTFRYGSVSHVLTILAGHAHDNNVEWNGLRHDSRDTLYRTPGGALPAGTQATLRFRTFHNDVTEVRIRVYSLDSSAQRVQKMTLAATDESCYQAGLESETCDYWAFTLSNATPDNLWYRFIVTDGTATAYYADNTPALDGGLGSPSDSVVDNSYALTVYDPGFTTPAWAKNAVIYQIFPDRFRNGRKDNDPKTGDLRYDDPVLKLPWGTLPEGYCRNYADGDTNCPWRFDPNPPAWSPTKEAPRGRDYMGGDLKGVDQNLAYLQSLGVNTIYFNPIFDSASNHGYDTQNYYMVDPYFGTQKDWENLVKHAKQLQIRIILDGVFNHLSSDSPFFDRYHRYTEIGACESLTSPYRSWFTFHDVAAGTGTCVDSSGNANSATYDGWFGFDSIPVLNKSIPEVQAYFLTNPNSVARYWLKQGASGWRMDVMGDSSFPAGYWETFRGIVQSTRSDALIIGELWQKDSTLLRDLRGDRADTTMNYRLRDAVVGLLTPGPYDSKGFADSGRILAPSEFASRLASIQEDYPDVVQNSLMNLLDSHDTERILWALTPGSEVTADKELNAANLARGKQLLRLATVVQMTIPGAPTIYYGDEVGVTGDDDPDDRRAFPWDEVNPTGVGGDPALLEHYRALTKLRQSNPVFRSGKLTFLLADDEHGTLAYLMRTKDAAAVVAVNRSDEEQGLDVDVNGLLPSTVNMYGAFGNVAGVAATDGVLAFTLPPLSAAILLPMAGQDLQAPAEPTNLQAEEGSGQVSLSWVGVAGATSYQVYRSPVSGGGYVRVGQASAAAYTDTGVVNGKYYYYVVRAVDGAGNEGAMSNEAAAMPHYTIGWANLQWPPTLTHTISTVNRTDNVYGQVWIDGVTNQPGATPSLMAQLGFGPEGSNPAGNPAWFWVDAAFNVDAGNNDEFVASLLPESTGTFDYLYRYSTTNGRDWLYADLNGPVAAGTQPPNPGKLAVNPSADTTPPSTPTGLTVIAASPVGIELAWDPVLGDPTLYGYEVRRSDTSGGPYTTLALVVGATDYVDAAVNEGSTYYYVVRSVDTSFNRSAASNEVTATAERRTVTVTFNVTVPATTDATGRSAYIAGTLDRLNGGLPSWDPGATVLTRVDAIHWTITLTGAESTAIEYKYTLGDWDHVEKDAACGEIANRQLTLSYGSNGTQTVNDTVLNWRNVAPCGN